MTGSKASLKRALAAITTGSPAEYGGLHLFPLVSEAPGEPPFDLSETAMGAGTVEVTELGEAGRVPELKVHNRGDRPVLFIEGVILIGAKQNRVVNLSILVPQQTEFTLPVSCVEQGRWARRSPRFDSSGFASPRIRSPKQESVLRSRRASGRADSDQYEVWAKVGQYLRDSGCSSSTADLDEGLRKADSRFRPESVPDLPPETRGILVGAGNRIIGMDLFDCPQTFEQVRARIIHGYASDSGLAFPGDTETEPPSPEAFLKKVKASARIAPKPIGLGEQIEVEAEDLVGTGLWYEGRICHLAVFGRGV